MKEEDPLGEGDEMERDEDGRGREGSWGRRG